MGALLDGFKEILKDLATERKAEGCINLMTVVNDDDNPYRLRLQPICPMCGGDLHSSGKYLHCFSVGCTYGREL